MLKKLLPQCDIQIELEFRSVSFFWGGGGGGGSKTGEPGEKLSEQGENQH